MLLAITALVFVGLLACSMPIVFALGVAALVGLFVGGYRWRCWPRAWSAASQNWVLLAIPASSSPAADGALRHEPRAGRSAPARWSAGCKGGLGMSVIVVAYFFSDICGSKMAEVSALGSTLMPPLTKAGYKPARTRPR